jgi:pimeloyl-ACP methyl ester carboxylesterase
MKRAALWMAGALAVAAVLSVAVFVWRPLRTLEVLGRGALRAAGFRHETIDGPRGPLSCFHKGSGRAILLLHGVNDQAGAWARVAGPLAASRRVVVADLPGHGGSAPSEGPLTIDDVLAGALALVDREAAAGPVDLVGNSMGGWIALLAARERPQQVGRVVLVNGVATTPPDHGLELAPRTREEARQAMKAIVGPATPDPPSFVLDDLVRRAPKSAMARLAGGIAPRHLLDGRLGEVRVPVALVWGEADGLLPVDYARQVAAQLPSATLATLPGCGHIPQRECPDVLLPALRAALGLTAAAAGERR